MNLRLTLLALCLCFSQCRQQNEPTPTELTIKFVDELRPQFLGIWYIREAQIKYRELAPVYYPTGITRDTLLRDLATVTFQPAPATTSDPRVLRLDGMIRFRSKDYPIQAELYPFQNAGLQKGVMFVNFNFGETINDFPPADIDYLYGIGLVGDNFAIDIVLGEPTMTWRGLGRAITSAILYKK